MKLILRILVFVFLLAGTLELALRLFDPWGAWRFAQDLQSIYGNLRTDSDRGYAYGHFQYSNWSATVVGRTTRLVPDTHPGSCTIVFLGDSVTFGQGVNDTETWVNLVAKALPDVYVINAGMVGYNLDNVIGTYKEFPEANGYIYLMIGNDASPAIEWQNSQRPIFALEVYVRMLPLVTILLPDKAAYKRIADLQSDPRMQIVAFDNNEWPIQLPGVRLIRPYQHRISAGDAHANPQGNEEIASEILPIARELIARVCH